MNLPKILCIEKVERISDFSDETSIGTLQFTIYNEHNGCYGHDVVIVNEIENTYSV